MNHNRGRLDSSDTKGQETKVHWNYKEHMQAESSQDPVDKGHSRYKFKTRK